MRNLRDRTKEQKNGELGLIIDEFGRAMWRANRSYITATNRNYPHFTNHMVVAWDAYVAFCRENPE